MEGESLPSKNSPFSLFTQQRRLLCRTPQGKCIGEDYLVAFAHLLCFPFLFIHSGSVSWENVVVFLIFEFFCLWDLFEFCKFLMHLLLIHGVAKVVS
jgi:hypothetical protein